MTRNAAQSVSLAVLNVAAQVQLVESAMLAPGVLVNVLVCLDDRRAFSALERRRLALSMADKPRVLEKAHGLASKLVVLVHGARGAPDAAWQVPLSSLAVAVGVNAHADAGGASLADGAAFEVNVALNDGCFATLGFALE